MKAHVIPMFQNAYPDVRFLTAAQIDPRDYYATYKLFIFYNDDHNLWQPCDYRQVGLCHGGTEITLCFYAGAHIATPAGEVAVEDLAAGDMVPTADGAAQLVVWLGRSTVSNHTRTLDGNAIIAAPTRPIQRAAPKP